MSEEEAERIRKHKNITIVAGHNVPKPVRTFEEASFPDYVLEEVACLVFLIAWRLLVFQILVIARHYSNNLHRGGRGPGTLARRLP